MKLLLMMLLAVGAQAQCPHNPQCYLGLEPSPYVMVPTPYYISYFSSNAADTLSSYVAKRFAEYRERWPQAHDFMRFSFKETQGFTINRDGAVTLQGITAEDALLAMTASKMEEELQNEDERDKETSRKTEEIAAVPPRKLKSKNGPVSVDQVAHLQALEITECYAGYGRIKVLMTDPNKRAGVLHEMMHVATWCNPDPALHKAIYKLMYPLLELMQDNPDMVDYLMRRKYGN